jgi:NNP family nitrate/nitrite transporter-like MFS transporter
MNLFARSWGGILSDMLATRWGMRGRITGMWVCQTLEGLACIMLGLVTVGYDSPHEDKFKGLPSVNSTWDAPRWEEPRFTTTFTFDSVLVPSCDSNLVRSPSHGYVNGVLTPMPIAAGSWITIRDPNPDCIHSHRDELLWLTLVCVVIFSVFVQMAEGLHFGIVPYISRPALGVVSGMVGAGGNTGAVIAGQYIIPAATAIDEGFIRLGAIIMGVSMIMHFIYFPEEGGILTGPGLGFDPQIIKPAQDQKGADELDFNSGQTSTTSSKGQTNQAV